MSVNINNYRHIIPHGKTLSNKTAVNPRDCTRLTGLFWTML